MTHPLSGGTVHIIGMGGIGMSAIAEVMAARGIAVQGSDQKDSANLRRLAAKGVKTFVGHDPKNIEGATMVVISTAVKPGNPELQAARELGIPVYNRAETLAALMEGYRNIGITGSHGKTTTTSMIATLLEGADLDPTALVGGIVRAWGSNTRIGHSQLMVVEADESDGTFIKLPLEVGIVTNIDPEHLDYYGTEEALQAAFRTYFTRIPPHGLAIAGIDHPVVRRLIEELRVSGELPPLLTYGVANDADIRVSNVVTNGGSVTFDVDIRNVFGVPLRQRALKLSVPGAHNALNASAAIGAALHFGVAPEQIFAAIARFEGVDRRFTQTGDWNGVSIYDDYAHHPAEIEAVLSAARGAAKGHVIAVMQPHRFSRLQALFDGFCRCFHDADMVLVAPVYAAGETPNGYDRDRLVEGIKGAGHGRVYAIDDENSLAAIVSTIARPGDLVIGLGAGTISEWARALPARLLKLTAFAGAAE